MPFGDSVVIYLYSYLPALSLAGFFWWLERYARKTTFLVIFAFVWGAFGANILAQFWNTFFSLALSVYNVKATANDMIVAVIGAPLVEEFTKGAMILILFRFKHIKSITDGVLLGIIIGLGFASSENVHYAYRIFSYNGELAMWYNLWFREIHTTLLHASATAVWGGMLGYARGFQGTPRIFTILNGYILAMVTHGFWNFMASYVGMVNSQNNIIQTIMRGELVVIFGSLLMLFLYSLGRQSRIIADELKEESARGVIPPEHVEFFAAMVRHAKKYTLPKRLTPSAYAQMGVALALLKHENRQHSSKILEEEIQNARLRLLQASEHTPDSLTLHYGR